MSLSAPTAPARPEPAKRRSAGIGGEWRFPLLVAGALLVLSTATVLWARTRPGFDPFGWLVWGRQTVAWSLNTNAAPSWKPLPYLFTAPYALFGHYQLWLWMITSVAISLSGSVFAARIAYRLVLVGDARRRAGALAAGAVAGVALLEIRDYSHYLLSAQADPMIVALCLGAIDCHLSGRRRWAFTLAVLASLGRPEVWPFLGLYSIWAWLREPSMRLLIGVGLGLLLVLWFGIPAVTSRSPFVAGTNALRSGRALHSNKITGTIDRFLDLHETPLEIVALLTVVWAAVRRDRVMLGLTAGAAGWVVLEIAFVLHGWPGVPRYMFPAAGVLVVIAAVGVGSVIAEPARLRRGAALAGVGVAVLIAASLVPPAISRARTERRDLRIQHARTQTINRLATTISSLGGAARLRECGEPLTRLEYQSVLAWELRVNVATVGFKYGPAIRRGRPIVLFTPGRHGWRVQALHQRLASCRQLPR